MSFLLSYTGVLRVVLTVLFSYTTVTHYPSQVKIYYGLLMPVFHCLGSNLPYYLSHVLYYSYH